MINFDEEPGEQDVKHHKDGGDKDADVKVVGKYGTDHETNSLSDETGQDGDQHELID
jgi:hypothetical protein